MAKFPHKTPFELHKYFREQNLSQLIQINREYGPHFLSLENRLEHQEAALSIAENRLSKLIENKRDFDLTYEKVVEDEAEFQRTLRGVLSDTDNTDRYIGRQAAGYSPMTCYEHTSLHIHTEMSSTAERVNSLKDIIADLHQKRTAAVSELRILNSVIEEKKRILDVQQQQTTTYRPGH